MIALNALIDLRKENYGLQACFKTDPINLMLKPMELLAHTLSQSGKHLETVQVCELAIKQIKETQVFRFADLLKSYPSKKRMTVLQKFLLSSYRSFLDIGKISAMHCGDHDD